MHENDENGVELRNSANTAAFGLLLTIHLPNSNL